MTRLPKEMPFELENCFIAGGSILSLVTKTDIADYDIYPKNKEGLESVLYSLVDDHGGFIVNISDRAITLKLNGLTGKNGNRVIVQIMFFQWFETAQDIFNIFDFTVCMGAYDFDSKEYIFHEDFYGDIASKTLRFNCNTKYPLNSLMRVSKYRNKGYFIGKFEYAKIALAIAKKGLPNSWEELEREIGGVYGKEIKLQSGENQLEYSYENAITVLSELDFDPDDYINNLNSVDENKYTDVTVDEIVNYFTDEPKEYIEISNSNSKNYCVFLEDQFFVGKKVCKYLIEYAGSRNFVKKNTSKLFGYTNISNSDAQSIKVDINNLTNKSTTISKNYYTQFTIYDNSDIILNVANNKSYIQILISYDIDNITRISQDNVITVKSKITFEKVIKDSSNTRLEDVFEVIDNAIHL
jgi:hypothetical protein